jgi:hypothetical protein
MASRNCKDDFQHWNLIARGVKTLLESSPVPATRGNTHLFHIVSVGRNGDAVYPY